MNIGDKVRIKKDPIAPILKGLEGEVVATEIFETQVLYVVKAENFGPYLPHHAGFRKVRAWKEGDVRKLQEGFLELV